MIPGDNRHCILGFLINAVLLNVYFILHCHVFFRKKIYFFEFLYFSEYDIRMSLCVFWLRKGPLLKYVPNCLGRRVHQKCVQLRTGGGSVTLHGTYALTLSLCRNLIMGSSETVIFLKRDPFLLSWNKIFSLKNYFCKPELAKALLTSIKKNLRYNQGIIYFLLLFNKLINADIYFISLSGTIVIVIVT